MPYRLERGAICYEIIFYAHEIKKHVVKIIFSCIHLGCP